MNDQATPKGLGAGGLPVSRAFELAPDARERQWLIENLWAEQAVGILGGEPKCCKSFLALDMAVSVASGMPCLRRFPVRRTGKVLIFPAEDSHGTVRQRLEGICAAANTAFDMLPLYVITAPRLLLDLPQDRQRLHETVAALRPALLVLDPFIRLHNADENASREVAPLLGYLRELQREFQLAVILVHHVRKRSGKDRPGQALRGSSDLHGWGDSNLYLRRKDSHLILSVEHRAAPASENIAVKLLDRTPALALAVCDAPPVDEPQAIPVTERIVQAMKQADQPISAQKLRKLCAMRTATLCETLNTLRNQGRVLHDINGYRLAQTAKTASSISFPDPPIGDAGNGNGKRQAAIHASVSQLPLFSGETQAGSAGTQLAQG
jgi:biotin operon repressor